MVRPKSHQPLDEAGTSLRHTLKAGERLGAIDGLLRRGWLRQPHSSGLRGWWWRGRGGHGCFGAIAGCAAAAIRSRSAFFWSSPANIACKASAVRGMPGPSSSAMPGCASSAFRKPCGSEAAAARSPSPRAPKPNRLSAVKPALKSGTVMSVSTTSQARAVKHIDSGREMNKTRKIGCGSLRSPSAWSTRAAPFILGRTISSR
jgi:hypothetical protein